MPYVDKLGENNGGDGYTVGTTVDLTIEPLDNTGAAVDPTTVSVSILLPAGTTAGPYTYANGDVTRHAAYFASGDIVYRYAYTTTTTGSHRATWTITGTGYTTVVATDFEVR